MSACMKPDERPGIDLAWGTTYSAFLAEAWPLIRPHWNEVGTFRDALRLDPDHDRYRAIERAGSLHILTARADDVMAGYLFMLIGKHPRDKSATIAKDDIFYVRPEYRRLNLGVRMIEEAISYMHGRADVLMMTEKLRRTAARGRFGGRYLERFGFQPLEVMWGVVLRNPHGDDQ